MKPFSTYMHSITKAALIVSLFFGVAQALIVPSVASAQIYYPNYSYGSYGNTSNNTQNLLPKCTLSANPVLVNSPYTTTLSWTTENAGTVSISDVGTVATTGQYTVPNIYGTRTFVLTATNVYGTRTCDVVVYGQGTPTYGYGGSTIPTYNPSTGTTGTPQDPGCYIAVNPSTLSGTNTTTLSWYGAGALSATISSIGTVPTSGTQSVQPTGSQTYTLTVFGLNGVSRTCSTAVQVAGASAYPYGYDYYSGYNGYSNYYDQYPYTATNAYTNYPSLYNDVAYAYGSGYRAPVTYGNHSVRLSRVPYTGPIDDTVGGIFSLSVLVSSLYGIRRVLG